MGTDPASEYFHSSTLTIRSILRDKGPGASGFALAVLPREVMLVRISELCSRDDVKPLRQ
jgi:hypothetical protein